MDDCEYAAYKSRRRSEKRRVYKFAKEAEQEVNRLSWLTKTVDGRLWRHTSNSKKTRFGERFNDSVTFGTTYSMNKHKRWERVTPESLLQDCDAEKANFCVVDEHLQSSHWFEGATTAKSVHWLNEDQTITTVNAKRARSQVDQLLSNANGWKSKKENYRSWYNPENKLDPNGKLRIRYTIYHPNPNKNIHEQQFWRYYRWGDDYKSSRRYIEVNTDDLAFDPFNNSNAQAEFESFGDFDTELSDEFSPDRDFSVDLMDFLRPSTSRRKKKFLNCEADSYVNGSEDYEIVDLDECLSESFSSDSTCSSIEFIQQQEKRIVEKAIFVDRYWHPANNITVSGNRCRTRPRLFDSQMNTKMNSTIGRTCTENGSGLVHCPNCSTELEYSEPEELAEVLTDPASSNLICPKCSIHFCPYCKKEPHFPMNCEEFEKWTTRFDVQYPLSIHRKEIDKYLHRVICTCGCFTETGYKVKDLVCPGCNRNYDPTDKEKYTRRKVFFRQGTKPWICTAWIAPKCPIAEVQEIDIQPTVTRDYAKLAVFARRKREEIRKGKELKKQLYEIGAERDKCLEIVEKIRMLLLLIEHGTGWLYQHRNTGEGKLKLVRKALKTLKMSTEDLLSNIESIDIHSVCNQLDQWIQNTISVFQEAIARGYS